MPLRVVFAVFVCLGSLATRVPGQGWIDRTGPNGPPPSYGHSMCYDPVHAYTLMVETRWSSGSGTFVGTTWTWDGSAWTNRGAAPAGLTALTWHGATQQLVGLTLSLNPGSGSTPTTLTGSLSVWAGSSWGAAGVGQCQVALPGGSSGPSSPTATGCYDSAHQESIFRPTQGGTPPVVFIYSGTNFAVRTAASGPPNELQYYGSVPGLSNSYGTEAMTWDPSVGKPVLARDSLYYQLIGSTWIALPIVRFYEWNGFGWNMRYPTAAPCLIGAMATDMVRNRIVLLDGEEPGVGSPGSSQPFHTWTYGNGECLRLQPPVAPAPRRAAAMAFDSQRGVAVLFGGVAGTWHSDTWEFDLGPLASFTPYGAGCLGSRGVPLITAQGSSRPRSGATFTAQISNLPWTGPAFLFAGLSDTVYGITPLPFDLGVIGAPNCSVRASCEVLDVLVNVLGSATWSFTVPPVPGASFYVQVFPLDPGANALGVTASNGARGVIGL